MVGAADRPRRADRQAGRERQPRHAVHGQRARRRPRLRPLAGSDCAGLLRPSPTTSSSSSRACPSGSAIPADVLTFLVFFAVALTTGGLTGRIRDQARATARRASAITALLAASRRLSAAARREDVASILAEQVSAATSGKVVVMLPVDGDEIVPAAGAPELEVLSTADMTAARWTWNRGEPAGAGTGTLPNVAWTFRSLQGVRAAFRRRRLRAEGAGERRQRALRPGPARPGRDRDRAGRTRRRRRRCRGAAPQRSPALGAAQLGQPRPAHPARHRARLGDDADRLWRAA
jgi:hypothetical protein